jgi:hypothetical protein
MRLWILVLASTLLTLTLGGRSAAPSEDASHLGVRSCASEPCHGAGRNEKVSEVVQDEYLIWARYDRHARAYSALTSPLGRTIAKNLGLKTGADNDPSCLGCHTDDAAAVSRGADGVGCEACHGAASTWYGPHSTGKIAHQELVDRYGLAAIDRPAVRAATCANCHFGDETRFVTHRMMGAGHPRLIFELATFSQLQPAHFVVDDVYRARKASPESVQLWAVGQAVMLERIMAELGRPRLDGFGGLPDLVFFDCYACHHPMQPPRWAPHPESMGRGPGTLRFNIANATMVELAARPIRPELAAQLHSDILQLNAVMGNPNDRSAVAARIAETARTLKELFAERGFKPSDMAEILTAMADRAATADGDDWMIAEQMTMGAEAIVATLKSDAGTYNRLKPALDTLKASEGEDQKDPIGFAGRMADLAAAAK